MRREFNVTVWVTLKFFSVVQEHNDTHELKISNSNDPSIHDSVKDRKFIMFESQLLSLLRRCHSCGQEVKLETSTVRTILVVSGTCPDGHVLKWQSQPMIKGMAAGNLLLSATILLCDLIFTSIANLADVLNLVMLSERRFMTYRKIICILLYIPYSAKCWWGETLVKPLYSCNWKVKLWRIE